MIFQDEFSGACPQTPWARISPKSLRLKEHTKSHIAPRNRSHVCPREASIQTTNGLAIFYCRIAKTRCRAPTTLEGTKHNSFSGGLDVIRKEVWPFYRTSSGVRLCWEVEDPEGPQGLGISGVHFARPRRRRGSAESLAVRRQ